MANKKIKKRVIVFSTPSCPHCRSAKKYFRQRGISFKDVDVSRDKAGARDMVRRSRQNGVPVIDIGGKIIVGFNRTKIDRFLDLR